MCCSVWGFIGLWDSRLRALGFKWPQGFRRLEGLGFQGLGLSGSGLLGLDPAPGTESWRRELTLVKFRVVRSRLKHCRYIDSVDYQAREVTGRMNPAFLSSNIRRNDLGDLQERSLSDVNRAAKRLGAWTQRYQMKTYSRL